MARIYQTPTMGEAHIRVAIVVAEEADLLVYRATSWGLATGDARWCITLEKTEATCWIYFTSLGLAQVKVCFVDTVAQAGWRNKDHKLVGRFK